MKRIWKTRGGILLVILALITLCFAGGTLAKYITNGNGGDTARVAKWGITVETEGNVFAKSYYTGDKLTVESENKIDKVIAPGTSGVIGSSSITGTAEVTVKVEYKPEFKLSGDWTVDGKFYCPLIIKVGDKIITGTKYPTSMALEATVNSIIGDYTQEYPPNTRLSDENTQSISWEWPFHISAENDIKDTKLGQKAETDTDVPTVTLDMIITVTQVD